MEHNTLLHPPCPGQVAPDSTITVASYNILSDCYIRVPGQPWNAFESCTDNALEWSNRLPKIVSTMRSSGADIICVQEMTFELTDALWGLPAWTEELRRDGYSVVMQKFSPKELARNAARNLRMVGKSIPTGLATFYKTDRFEECAASKHGSGSGIALFLRARGGSGGTVFVNNIHLVGDPSKFEMHIKQLNPVAKNFDTVVCGDFNGDVYSGEETEVTQWFRERAFQRADTGPSWAGGDYIRRLDHVMHRLAPVAGAGAAEVVCCQPEEGEDSALRAAARASCQLMLPNDTFPSDHMLIRTTFRVSR